MRLSGEQFLQLQVALLEAFPIRDMLRQMVRVRLDLNLDTIAEGNNLTEVVARLITWSEDNERVEALIEGARLQVPESANFQAAADTLLRSLRAPADAEDPRQQVRSQVLEQLAEDYGVELVIKGARRIRSRSPRLFMEEVFPEHKVFGGRQAEQASLAKFIGGRSNGYAFVTGPTGFGKTALLANYCQALEARQLGVAFHFITPLIDASEQFCLQSLCEQLLVFHGLGGEIPDSERDLRMLYADLLRLPPVQGQKLVVFLDGLDEALGYWNPRPSLFPEDLAEGVQVVFSAGEIADKAWLDELGMSLPGEQVVTLGPLGLADIQDILDRSKVLAGNGRASPDETATQLLELSEGDPFYLQELLKRAGEMEKLEKPPVGLDRYLKTWWIEASQGIQEQAFTDFLGTLAAARGPLRRQELIDLSPEDSIQGVNFDGLIARTARYVVGSEAKGYQLSHSRIREFVADRLSDVYGDYQNRMADYTLRWNQDGLSPAARDYMFAHAAQHLVDAGRWQDLLDLLGPGWIQAKWQRFGSYSAFIPDLDTASAAALAQEPPDYAGVAALGVARQTAREIMLGFPATLLQTWVRLGEVDRVLALLKSLGTVKGRAVEPYLAVIETLLEVQKEAKGPVKTDYGQTAAELLGSALGMLPLVRSSENQLDHFATIATLLSSKGLPQDQTRSLLEQAEQFALSRTDPTLRACAIGWAARAHAAVDADRKHIEVLVQEGRTSLERIDYAPDRSTALAHLLPAMEWLEPGALEKTLRSLLEDPGSLYQAGSIGGSPLGTLVNALASDEAGKTQVAADLLTSIGEDCVARIAGENGGYGSSEASAVNVVVRALAKLGYTDFALDLIQKTWDRSPVDGARAAFAGAIHLSQPAPDQLKSYLEKARALSGYEHFSWHVNRELFASNLAPSLARVGEWETAFSLLETIRMIERVDAIENCLDAAGETFQDDPDRLSRVVERLVAAGASFESEERSRVYAAAGDAMLKLDRAKAETYVNRAAKNCLSHLPEGDTDEMRQLLALARHEEGDYAGARAALQPLKWGKNAIKTYRQMLEALPEDQNEGLAIYAEGIRETLLSTQEDGLRGDSLVETALAAEALRERLPAGAESLCDYILNDLTNLRSISDYVKCFNAQAVVRTRIDADTGIAHFDWLIDRMSEWLNSGDDVGIYAVSDILMSLREIAQIAPDDVGRLVEKVATLKGFFTGTEEEKGYSLDVSLAAALAGLDAERAFKLLGQEVEKLQAMGQEAPQASKIMRMFSEFTGRQAGARYHQAQLANQIGSTVFSLATDYPEQAGEVLGALIEAVGTIDSAKDRAQAVVEYMSSCREWLKELPPPVSDSIVRAQEIALGLPEPGLVAYALNAIIETYCHFGDYEAAERVADLFESQADIDEAAYLINTARERSEIGPLSLVEKAYVDVLDPDLPYSVLRAVKQDKEQEEAVLYFALDNLAKDLVPWERHRLLSDWLQVLIVPALRFKGTGLATEIIERSEAYDHVFLQAAELTAAD